MSIFKVEIEKKGIIVKATIPAFDPNRHPRMRVTTSDVERHLEEEKILHGKCISGAGLNNRSPTKLSGTWIFEFFEKKIEKPLDKPAEKVILSKEEKPAPKKRKSRAKKKTTK
jgi:hypothetical protein